MILKGDCIEVMKAMKPNSVDAIVTDPPYGLEFMGKEWDKFRVDDTGTNRHRGKYAGKQGTKGSSNRWGKNGRSIPSNRLKYGGGDRPKTYRCVGCGKRDQFRNPHTCLNEVSWKVEIIDPYAAPPTMLAYQEWSRIWLTEAYRVLKPGGSMLVMGGTRTSHRLACAIEDSGFIIKDTLMWLYGSGFPKAQDLGKMIDKRNGRHPNNIKFRKYLKNQRNKSCVTMENINKAIGTSTMAGHWFGETQCTLPSVKQYKILKDILGLDNRFDELIKREEAEREKIGERITGAAMSQKPSGEKMGTGGTCFGSGQNKIDITTPNLDLAKHWDGFKVGTVKPAYEPIIWAVKPPEGSYVDNVLKWGVGAVNVDECRISTNWNNDPTKRGWQGKSDNGWFDNKTNQKENQSPKGRFPANVILSHHPECVQVGMKKVKSESHHTHKRHGKITYSGKLKDGKDFGNLFAKDGLETVESWDCHPDCAVRLLDEQSGNRSVSGTARLNKPNTTGRGIFGNCNPCNTGYMPNDNGGASRFFYCAKSSRAERNAGLEGMEEKIGGGMQGTADQTLLTGSGNIRNNRMKNNHPTVKPIKLFEWLIKLVTREGQIILDPFIGSGTTAIAAHNTGRKCVGIEKEDEYLTIAKRRIDYWKNQPKQMEMRI